MTKKPIFNIANARDFFDEIVLPQYEDFKRENSSCRHAILTAIVAYHMYEWANQTKFASSDFTSRYPTETGLADFFELARNLTNGTKHFLGNVTTRTQTGFSSGFSDDFARPLNIQLADGSEISVDQFLQKLIEFWERQKANGAI